MALLARIARIIARIQFNLLFRLIQLLLPPLLSFLFTFLGWLFRLMATSLSATVHGPVRFIRTICYRLDQTVLRHGRFQRPPGPALQPLPVSRRILDSPGMGRRSPFHRGYSSGCIRIFHLIKWKPGGDKEPVDPPDLDKG